MKPKYILLSIITLMQIASALLVWYASDKDEATQISVTNAWMLMNAMAWVFAFTIIALLTTGLFRQLVMILCMMWLSNAIDEVWFDPTQPQWNDIVALVIAEHLAFFCILKNHFKKS